jgi:hypothetical protein
MPRLSPALRWRLAGPPPLTPGPLYICEHDGIGRYLRGTGSSAACIAKRPRALDAPVGRTPRARPGCTAPGAPYNTSKNSFCESLRSIQGRIQCMACVHANGCRRERDVRDERGP